MRLWLMAVVVCAGLAGCTPAPRPPAVLAAEMSAGPLAFLRDEETTREAVLLRLGIPTADFEGQRIMTYRVYYNAKTGMAVLPRDRLVASEETVWRQGGTEEGLSSSVVLVFDERQVLVRHSVVPMEVAVNK